jgi:hypothetical protein
MSLKNPVTPPGIDPGEYGRIILKWMLRKYIRMVFDCSYLGRALNNILMNPIDEPSVP